MKDGLILLGLRAAHKSFAGCWDVIGGHVAFGETAWAALCRELAEELGVEIERGYHLAALQLLGPSRDSSTLDIYAVTAWNGEPSVQNDEHVELKWFLLHEAARLTNLATPQYREVFGSVRI